MKASAYHGGSVAAVWLWALRVGQPAAWVAVRTAAAGVVDHARTGDE